MEESHEIDPNSNAKEDDDISRCELAIIFFVVCILSYCLLRTDVLLEALWKRSSSLWAAFSLEALWEMPSSLWAVFSWLSTPSNCVNDPCNPCY